LDLAAQSPALRGEGGRNLLSVSHQAASQTKMQEKLKVQTYFNSLLIYDKIVSAHPRHFKTGVNRKVIVG
jgi:hypothetical protein